MKHTPKLISLLLVLIFAASAFISCGSTQDPPSGETSGSVSGTENGTSGAASGEDENIPVSGISLDRDELSLPAGESVKLNATIIPENATVTRVFWTSDNKTVATVSDGTVTAISEGTTTITVTTKDGGFKAECKVTVENKEILVESISFDQTELTMVPGQTEKLSVSILPLKAAGSLIQFYSSNRSVAQIDSDGTVTAVGEGTATITAYSENYHYATCSITVVDAEIPVTNVALSKSSMELKIGQAEEVKVTILPTNATNKHYTITTDHPDILSIDGNFITGIAEGKAQIIVTTEDGGYRATCSVTVSGSGEKIDLLNYTGASKIRDTEGYDGGIRKKSSGEILFSPSLSELRLTTAFRQKQNYEDYIAYVRFTFAEPEENGEYYSFPCFSMQAVQSKGDWVDFYMQGADIDCGFCPVAGIAYKIEFALVNTQVDPNKAVISGVYNFTASEEIADSPYYRPNYGPGRKEGEFIIRYIAGDHGRIEGEERQIITADNPSRKVVAVPDDGYVFISWSDGVKTAERSGDTTRFDIKITAYFTTDATNTGIPSMYIYTASGEPVTRKVYETATMTIVDAGEEYNFDSLPLQIRGRGNSSWSGSSQQWAYDSKNSYRVKFDEKIQLLGLGSAKNKDWVLNSNKFDLSGLRNFLVWTLANKMGTIPYVPECAWVQLYVNDQYRGMYMVTELVENAKGRVEVNDKIAGTDKGFLLEFDFRGNYDDEPYFYMPGYGPDPVRKLHDAVEICIKSKITSTTDDHGVKTYAQDEIDAIKDYMLKCNEAVFSGKRSEMEKYFDMPSFIDMYIIEELSKDCDTGRASFFVSKNPGEKLFCTAPWDFDFGFGTYGPATSYWGLVSDGDEVCPWYGFLVGQKWFRDEVLARMEELNTALAETLETVREKGNELKNAADTNAYFWKMYNNNYHQYVSSRVSGNLGSYEEHLDFIEDWTNNRWAALMEALRDYA